MRMIEMTCACLFVLSETVHEEGDVTCKHSTRTSGSDKVYFWW